MILQEPMSLRPADRAVVTRTRPKEKLRRRRNAAERSDVITPPRPLVQHDSPAAHTSHAHTLASLEVRPRHRDLAENVSIRPEDLAHGPGQQLGDAIPDLGYQR